MDKKILIFVLLSFSLLIVAGCQDTVGRNPTIQKCSGYTGSYGQAACGQDKNCEWDNELNKCVDRIKIPPATLPREQPTPVFKASVCDQYAGSPYAETACSQDKNCKWTNNKCVEKT
ncbi:MAG TPA: hypothetical protein VJJ53_02795 [Candidatus Nanoarchaeia archaeon]|nr:hypothetical protein [Candidatus Woesearchaeota archaeon]HLC37682.1 hypothetical protein [Candidatus Nanoarchaeia archaeon]